MAEARYRTLDIDDLAFGDLNAVYRYWRAKRDTETSSSAKRLAPPWSEIELIELPAALIPRVCVVDVVGAGDDFRYRFWGTEISRMHHYDLSGRSVRALTPPHYAACIFAQYKAVFDARRPLAFLTEVPLENGLFTFYVAARLPLADDGERIDRIMSVEEYGDERGQLEKLFETIA